MKNILKHIGVALIAIVWLGSCMWALLGAVVLLAIPYKHMYNYNGEDLAALCIAAWIVALLGIMLDVPSMMTKL